MSEQQTNHHFNVFIDIILGYTVQLITTLLKYGAVIILAPIALPFVFVYMIYDKIMDMIKYYIPSKKNKAKQWSKEEATKDFKSYGF